MQRCPSRSHAHAPPPAPASVRMSPALLRTGPEGKTQSSRVGIERAAGGQEKLGAPAANAGAGARRVGGRAAISRLNMRLRRPTILPCAPRPRFFFASTRAAGRGQWVARASPPIALPVLAHSKRRLLAVNHRLLTHCRHGSSPTLEVIDALRDARAARTGQSLSVLDRLQLALDLPHLFLSESPPPLISPSSPSESTAKVSVHPSARFHTPRHLRPRSPACPDHPPPTPPLPPPSAPGADAHCVQVGQRHQGARGHVEP